MAETLATALALGEAFCKVIHFLHRLRSERKGLHKKLRSLLLDLQRAQSNFDLVLRIIRWTTDSEEAGQLSSALSAYHTTMLDLGAVLLSTFRSGHGTTFAALLLLVRDNKTFSALRAKLSEHQAQLEFLMQAIQHRRIAEVQSTMNTYLHRTITVSNSTEDCNHTQHNTMAPAVVGPILPPLFITPATRSRDIPVLSESVQRLGSFVPDNEWTPGSLIDAF